MSNLYALRSVKTSYGSAKDETAGAGGTITCLPAVTGVSPVVLYVYMIAPTGDITLQVGGASVHPGLVSVTTTAFDQEVLLVGNPGDAVTVIIAGITGDKDFAITCGYLVDSKTDRALAASSAVDG